MLSIGSLFSGIGGLELGLERAGLGPVLWQAESDEWRRSVLAAHWPDVTRYEDVRHVDGNAKRPDIICGGFPCQDLSSAGKRAGLSGEKSGLWVEFRRIVEIIRPRLVVVENVRSGAANWVDAIRGNLGELGYASLPIPLEACWLGAPYERARVFVVAHADRSRQLAVSKHGQVGPPQPPTRDGESTAPAFAWASSNAGEVRQGPAESECHASSIPSWAGGRFAEPEVVRVVPGFPAGLDTRRRKALGDCVVPQMAEVVGHFIQDLIAC